MAFLPEIMPAIRQVEEKLGVKSRLPVRCFGTRNIYCVIVEGPTRKETATYCCRIADVVEKYRPAAAQ